MKLLRLFILVFFSLSSLAQKDTSIITTREDIPLQAVLDIQSTIVLFAGQEYTFNITSSGSHDLQLTAKNAKVHLIEESKKSTGGLMYTVTPIKTGECSFILGNIVNKVNSVSLKMQTFSVIDYTVPPLHFKGIPNSQIITNLNALTSIQCAYPKESGVYDTFEIESWSASIGEKTFSGKENVLSKELIEYVNKVDNQFLHLKASLSKNKTGHLISEAIYLIR